MPAQAVRPRSRVRGEASGFTCQPSSNMPLLPLTLGEGVHGDVIAGLPGVEVFDVAVKLVVGGNFAYLAESQVGGDIVAAAVVVYV